MAIGSDYYNPADKVVYDGDIAQASDLNSINTAVDTALETVSTDIVEVDAKISVVADDSEKWATDEQGTNPDPLQITEYSSKANAEESKAWAGGTGGVDTEADGTTTITRSAREYVGDIQADAAQTAADVVSTGLDVIATNADVVLTGLDVVSTNADVVSTNADVVTTNADVLLTNADVIAASGFADDAAAAVIDAVEKTSDTGQAIIPSGTTLQSDTPAAGHLRFDTDESKFLGYDGLEWASLGGGGLKYTASTVSITAEEGLGYYMSGTDLVVTLPLNPEEGDTVGIKDSLGTFATSQCTVDGNGENIQGLTEDLYLDQNNMSVVLAYTDATTGWVIVGATPYAEATVSETNKNFIINGNFDVWQRGTSQTTSNYASADRFQFNVSGGTQVVTQEDFTLGQAEVPGNPTYFVRVVATSQNLATSSCLPQTKLEGVETLSGKTATMSFWAKADAGQSVTTELSQQFGTGGTPSGRVTGIGTKKFQLTTTLQKFSVTFDIPSVAGKTIGTDGNDHLSVAIWLDGGSDYDARTDFLGNQSGTFDIAQIKLEEGSIATEFAPRSYSEELALCQRYYQYYPSIPDANSYRTTSVIVTSRSVWTLSFLVNMRVNPTVTLTGTAENCTNIGRTISTHSIGAFATPASTSLPFRYHSVTLELDSEL